MDGLTFLGVKGWSFDRDITNPFKTHTHIQDYNLIQLFNII